MSSIASHASDVEWGTNLCDDGAQDAQVLELPLHWIFERGNHPWKHYRFCWCSPVLWLHRFLCNIGFGVGNLYKVREVSYPSCPAEVWEDERDRLRKRLEHINLVVRPQGFDGQFSGFDNNFWPRLACFFLRWRSFAPRSLPGTVLEE